jgi:hypothetical protein
MKQEIMLEFKEAVEFLESHPAFINPLSRGVGNSRMMVVKVCKNGLALDGTWKRVTIYKDQDEFEDWVDKVPEERKRYCWNKDFSENTDKIFSIEVDYEEYFGYSWEFHNVEVWIEGGATRYLSKCVHTKKDRWENWHDADLDSSGLTYEAAMIEYAKKVKKLYGDFSCWGENSIIPKWVDEYNKGKRAIYFVDSDTDGFKKMESNPEYLSLSDGVKNEIWWQLWGKEHLPSMYSISEETVNVSHLLDYDVFKSIYLS